MLSAKFLIKETGAVEWVMAGHVFRELSVYVTDPVHGSFLAIINADL